MKKTVLLSLICFTWELAGVDSLVQYEQQFARDPGNYAALYNAGVTAFKTNNHKRAKECFDALKPLSEQNLFDAQRGEQLFYNAGNTEVKLQAYEDAVKSFEKVLTYNPDNEKARAKLEYAKQMLEQQKQQEQKPQDKQNQDQDQKNNDNKEQDDSQQNQQDQQQNQENNQERNSNNQKDEQREQQQQQKKEETTSEEKQKQEQKAEQQKNADQKEQQNQQQQQQQKEEPELTQEEQQLLTAVQNLDQRMQGALEARKLKKAQGAVHANHNW